MQLLIRCVATMSTLATMAVPISAEAKDPAVCKAGLVCASDPQTVINALQAQGYKAKLDVDDQGDPDVVSAASGYNFDVLFYGCVEHKQCDSLQFRVTFTKDPSNTLKLVNTWNLDKRFGQMSLRNDGSIALNQDITTVGGLTKENFDDAIDWWNSVLGALPKFFDENLPPVKK